MDTRARYTIRPKKRPGVELIQQSALEDIVGVLKAILGDTLYDHEIWNGYIVILTDRAKMDDVIRRSNLRESCVIERKDPIFQ